MPRHLTFRVALVALAAALTGFGWGRALAQHVPFGGSPAFSGSRIVELAATPDAAANDLIREPGGTPPEVKEPPAPPPAPAASVPRTSPYIPLEAPPLPAPLSEPPLPELAARPTFAVPHDESPQTPPAPPARSEPFSPSPPFEIPPGFDLVERLSPDPVVTQPIPPASRPPAQPDLLRPVVQRAAQISDRGFAMAQRGMLYAGRNELLKSLQLVAQSLDMLEGGTQHGEALARGLAALEEARDFANSSAASGRVVPVAHVAAPHRTPLFKSSAADLSPIAAQQQYFGYAQAQLALAGGSLPVASQALYRLGRLEAALAGHDADPQALHGPKAMVFHQAALAVDGSNFLAANELGVLLARYGQLDDARRLLLHSISTQPQVESWHNLAAVHRRLGEEDLARRAETERDLVAKQTGSAAARQAGDLIRWVDPPTFAASGRGDVPWPDATATRSAAPNNPQRR
jgi:hypothetical protein